MLLGPIHSGIAPGHGAYSATVKFAAYADICSNGQEGYYFQP